MGKNSRSVTRTRDGVSKTTMITRIPLGAGVVSTTRNTTPSPSKGSNYHPTPKSIRQPKTINYRSTSSNSSSSNYSSNSDYSGSTDSSILILAILAIIAAVIFFPIWGCYKLYKIYKAKQEDKLLANLV